MSKNAKKDQEKKDKEKKKEKPPEWHEVEKRMGYR